MPATLDERSPTSTVDIADDGDIVLVIGPEKERLRISSLSLMSASKVFRSMFGPNFSEGQNLGSGTKEVLLPEDNAGAMKIICDMIHFRSVPEEIETGLMLQIAVTADKFDCRTVLQHISTLWLNPTKSKDMTELAQLMASSYLLDNSKAFGLVTLEMIYSHGDSYLALAEEDIGLDPRVLLRICYLLEERRSLFRSKIAQLLSEGATISGSSDRQCSCAWSEKRSLAYMELLRSSALQPRQLHSMSLTQTLDKIDNLSDPTLSRSDQQISCGYRWHSDPSYRATRNYGISLLRAEKGLCIDCVQRGAAASTLDCRIKH